MSFPAKVYEINMYLLLYLLFKITRNTIHIPGILNYKYGNLFFDI